jgi:hypothetical protein
VADVPPFHVHALELVVATTAMPLGVGPRVDVVIDRVSLLDRVNALEHPHGGHGPLHPDDLLPPLRQALTGARLAWGPILGCGCDVHGCSPLAALIHTGRRGVVWERFEDHHGTLPGIGSFVFARKQYETALAQPREADRLVTDQRWDG